MTAVTTPRPAVNSLFRQMREDAPALTVTMILMLLCLTVFAVTGLLDDRVFNGISVWMKPAKFAFSLTVYAATFAFLARYVTPAKRATWWWRGAVGLAVFSMIVEIIWIGAAAAQGIASHFNVDQLVFVLVYPLMGLLATILTALSTVFAIAIHRNRETGLPPLIKSALVWGLAITLPLTLITAGTLSSGTGHWVGGTPSDAGGVFFFGWSRDGGDLRVAHFFATHALHAVPLAALAAYALGQRAQIWAPVLAVGFTAFIGLTFAQALMGMPFIGA